MDAQSEVRFVYDGEDARLDKVVVASLAESASVSRSQVEGWIERGAVRVNGVVVPRPGARIKRGDQVIVAVPPPQGTHLEGFSFPLGILYEDEHLLVINKPAGLSMHPGSGNSSRTLANAVVAHVGGAQQEVGDIGRPGIVHRLDKDTTGVVVVAKTSAAHTALAAQFAARSIGREYLALVYTTPRARRIVQQNEHGEVIAPIGRHPSERTRMAVVEGGKKAKTLWRVIERFSYGTLVACRLETGRTHQIRVHMDSIHSPVIGDPLYGDFSNLPRALKEAAQQFGRQALHAAELRFIHPSTKEQLEFRAEVPEDMTKLVEAFRGASGEVP